jgi:hypothetical protein
MSGLAQQLRSGRRASAKRVLPSHTYRLQFVMGCVLVSLWSLFDSLHLSIGSAFRTRRRGSLLTLFVIMSLLQTAT